MSKNTPAAKYFVGKLKKPKFGHPYRIFRRRLVKSMLGKRMVEEMCTADGWKRVKAEYSQVSNLFGTRNLARAEKHRWEGKK